MPDTYTTNFDLVLPEPGGSIDTWGDKLNDNFSRIDTLIEGRVAADSPVLGSADDLFAVEDATRTYVVTGQAPDNYPGQTNYANVLHLGSSAASSERALVVVDSARNLYFNATSSGTWGDWRPVFSANGGTITGAVDLQAALTVTGATALAGLTAASATLSGPLDMTGATVDNAGRVNLTGELAWYGNGAGSQRGATADVQGQARLHWYGSDSNGDAVPVNHAYYAGNDEYITLTANDGVIEIGQYSTRGGLRAKNFIGDGVYLTNLNAFELASGTVPAARIESTRSRTSTSTTALLQAAGMNDHRQSGDHDGRYFTQAQVTGTQNVGSYALLRNKANTTIQPSQTVPGSQLVWAAASGATQNGAPPGTWRCMGYSMNGSNADRTTLFVRIS